MQISFLYIKKKYIVEFYIKNEKITKKKHKYKIDITSEYDDKNFEK